LDLANKSRGKTHVYIESKYGERRKKNQKILYHSFSIAIALPKPFPKLAMPLQPIVPPIPTGTSLDGKTVLITGGNSGMGLGAARQMVTLGASRVIITSRNTSKGAEAVQSLRRDPTVIQSNPNAKIEVFALDVDDYKSGMKFCDQVKKEVPRLDILVCNAGVHFMRYESSISGHERVMQGQ
jgi:short chain dehydrogenase